MARRKRNLAGQDVRALTLRMRAPIYDKLSSLAGPQGSIVETIEQMTEYLFARKLKRAEKHEQHNAN